jgi:hypothetical protein
MAFGIKHYRIMTYNGLPKCGKAHDRRTQERNGPVRINDSRTRQVYE